MKMKEMVMADSKYVKCKKKNYNILCWLLKCTMIIKKFKIICYVSVFFCTKKKLNSMIYHVYDWNV